MGIKIGKAKTTNRKLRIGVFGKESVGKTHFGLSGENPILFDIEGRGDSMTGRFGEFPVVEYNSNNMSKDLLEAADALKSGNAGDFATFVIDSWTMLEKDFKRRLGLDTMANSSRVKNLGDQRDQIEREILNPLLSGKTKCHIVVIAHEANEWTDQKVVGAKPDATRNWKHYFDIVLHMTKDPVRGEGQDPKRTATVVKSNYQDVLPIGMRIENFEWKDLESILNNSVQIIPINNEELKKLFIAAGSPEGSIKKWFASESIEMTNNDTQISPEDSHKAKGLLESLIEDASLAEVS